MTHTIRLQAGVITVTAGVLGILALAIATSSSAAETAYTTYVTGYSYYDNSPPGTDISDPVVHQKAGGTGTYADPTTVAVGIVGGKPMFTPGTRFYIPNLRRYFVVEDTCAECAANVPAGAANWIDVWVDGSATSTAASNACMDAITGNWKTIKDPAANYAVSAGIISKASGCTAQYGDTLVTTSPPATTTPVTTPPTSTTTPTKPPTTTTTTTAARATSLSCPIVTSPTVGQTVTCTYR